MCNGIGIVIINEGKTFFFWEWAEKIAIRRKCAYPVEKKYFYLKSKAGAGAELFIK